MATFTSQIWNFQNGKELHKINCREFKFTAMAG